MRRFDKLKVIKEANQTLEEKFLSSKTIILEEDSPSTGDFNLFKKELSLKGGDSEASGIIPGGNGKKIDIKSDGNYTIKDVDNTEKQVGTFKSVGIWPTKHIELKPSGETNFFKIKNILLNIDKQDSASSETETDFFNTFKNLVRNPKNLTVEDGYYSYSFYTNKKSDVTVSIHITPNQDDYKIGTFKMSWKSPTKSGAPIKWTGKFQDSGNTFISDNPKEVGSIGKNGKIDSGLIKILSVFWPKYQD